MLCITSSKDGVPIGRACNVVSGYRVSSKYCAADLDFGPVTKHSKNSLLHLATYGADEDKAEFTLNITKRFPNLFFTDAFVQSIDAATQPKIVHNLNMKKKVLPGQRRESLSMAWTPQHRGDIAVGFNCVASVPRAQVLVVIKARIDRSWVDDGEMMKQSNRILAKEITIRLRMLKNCSSYDALPISDQEDKPPAIINTPADLNVDMIVNNTEQGIIPVVQDDIVNQMFVAGSRKKYIIPEHAEFVSFVLSENSPTKQVRILRPIVFVKDSSVWSPVVSSISGTNSMRMDDGANLIDKSSKARFELTFNCLKKTTPDAPAVAVVRIPFKSGGGTAFQVTHVCGNSTRDRGIASIKGRPTVAQGIAITTADKSQVVVVNGRPTAAFMRADEKEFHDMAHGAMNSSSTPTSLHTVGEETANFDFIVSLSNLITLTESAPSEVKVSAPDVFVSPGKTALAYVDYRSLNVKRGEENEMSLRFACREEGIAQVVVIFKLFAKKESQGDATTGIKGGNGESVEEAMFAIQKRCSGRDNEALKRAATSATDTEIKDVASFMAGTGPTARVALRQEDLSPLYIATSVRVAASGKGNVVSAGTTAPEYRISTPTGRHTINADDTASMAFVLFTKDRELNIGTPSVVALRRSVALPELSGDLLNGGIVRPVEEAEGAVVVEPVKDVDEATGKTSMRFAMRNSKSLLLTFHCIGSGTTPIFLHIPVYGETARRIVRIAVNKVCSGLHHKDGLPGSGVDVRRVMNVDVDGNEVPWEALVRGGQDPNDPDVVEPPQEDEDVVVDGVVGVTTVVEPRTRKYEDVVVDGVVQPNYLTARDRRTGSIATAAARGDGNHIDELRDDDLERRFVVPEGHAYTLFELSAHEGKAFAFHTPQVVSFRPHVARATVDGPAADGGLLNSRMGATNETMTFTLNYVCGSRNGTALIHVAIPLKPAGMVDFVVQKKCGINKGLSVGRFVEGLYVGTSAGASNVIQNGITQPKFRRWVDEVEAGTQRLYVDAKTRNLTFWVRSDPPHHGQGVEMLVGGRPIVSPIAVTHFPIANPKVVGDLRHGGVLTSTPSSFRINFHCVMQGLTPVTIYIPLRNPSVWSVDGDESDRTFRGKNHHMVVGFTIVKECAETTTRNAGLENMSVEVDGVLLHGHPDGGNQLTHVFDFHDYVDNQQEEDAYMNDKPEQHQAGGAGRTFADQIGALLTTSAKESMMFTNDANYDYDTLWHDDGYGIESDNAYDWRGGDEWAVAGVHEEEDKEADMSQSIIHSLDKNQWNAAKGVSTATDFLGGAIDIATTEAKLAHPDVVNDGVPTGRYKICEEATLDEQGYDNNAMSGCPINAIVARDQTSFIISAPIGKTNGEVITLGAPTIGTGRHAVTARVDNPGALNKLKLKPGDAARMKISFKCKHAGISTPVVVSVPYNSFMSTSFRFTKVCGMSDTIGWTMFSLMMVVAAAVTFVFVPFAGHQVYRHRIKLREDME